MQYLSMRLSAAMWARVLLLWLTLTVVAVVLGIGVLLLGQFVQSNVQGELAAQQISFGAADNLSEEEKAIPGLLENAGLPVTTGNQAKIYSELIALHMRESAEAAGYPDATYATLGGIQRQFRAAVATAKEANDAAALEAAEASLAAVSGLRTTMQTGSTLRGTLLSAYGWDNVATGVITAGIAFLGLAVVSFLLFVFEWRRGHLPPVEA